MNGPYHPESRTDLDNPLDCPPVIASFSSEVSDWVVKTKVGLLRAVFVMIPGEAGRMRRALVLRKESFDRLLRSPNTMRYPRTFCQCCKSGCSGRLGSYKRRVRPPSDLDLQAYEHSDSRRIACRLNDRQSEGSCGVFYKFLETERKVYRYQL